MYESVIAINPSHVKALYSLVGGTWSLIQVYPYKLYNRCINQPFLVIGRHRRFLALLFAIIYLSVHKLITSDKDYFHLSGFVNLQDFPILDSNYKVDLPKCLFSSIIHSEAIIMIS